jgi:hypothetical protein
MQTSAGSAVFSCTRAYLSLSLCVALMLSFLMFSHDSYVLLFLHVYVACMRMYWDAEEFDLENTFSAPLNAAVLFRI